MYRREIVYVGLYKNEDRVGNAGFLKAESGQRGCRLYLKAQNIPPGVSGRFPVRIYDGRDWKELGSVSIQNGGGCWEERTAELAAGPIVQIRLSGGYVLEGRSREAKAPKELSGAAPEPSDDRNADGTADDRPQPSAQEPRQGREQTKEQTEPPEDAEAVMVAEELPRGPMREPAAEKAGRSNGSPKEDKWEQIQDTFERLHPYGDERVYVKLEPKDFVILQEKYQHLVNNSFLLHGFYNYRYVILGKEHGGYYLGVPGVFYEREKMVAQMFGFEAFECPGGEVKTGEFGYYLRGVEL